MRWQEVGRAGTIYYPIWLSYAAGLLEKEGHKIRLLDAPAEGHQLKQVIQDIRCYSPDMIVIDTSFASLKNDINVAREIKLYKQDSLIVGVGPPTSQFANRMLNGGFDIVARYEYDWTLAELAKTVENGRSLNLSLIHI